MTRKEKQHLAGGLATAAADWLSRRIDDYGLTPEQAKAEREQVARWLQHLPGDEWDRRLPDPVSL